MQFITALDALLCSTARTIINETALYLHSLVMVAHDDVLVQSMNS